MSKGNLAFLDEATVKMLQVDSPVARRTIEWITEGVLTPDFSNGYKIGIRRPVTNDGTKPEVDINLEDTALVFAGFPDEQFCANLHVEIEAAHAMTDLRMFMYDYRISWAKADNKSVLRFPVSFVVLLTCAKDAADSICRPRGFTAYNAVGKPICVYQYFVKKLSPSCAGTIFEPIELADRYSPVETAEDTLCALLDSIQSIAGELPKELGATYASNIYQGLEQRFTTLFDKADKAISDKEGKALVSNIRQLVERSQGKEIAVMGPFTTLLATARRERAEGIEEGKLAVYAKLMKKFNLQTPEEVDRFLDDDDEDRKLGSLDLSSNK